ncbi:endonuclease/exonuclease/phosphatase family protein [Blastopirellula sp. JC732]|uniref:Endonuclease/exonuclease/phosphatase family protein n=1 Tax=Blastopirellula sediminis TaxID=2894196 RepID=A0A9X1MJF8_9BACT|nr:endonuclease/exonuclease/phosphatase family protein [Blastopirellula sediminis]MCC9609045.1 endonuclease/exonuclease/phosphatase family protein [Blastopirellula sediminis]MCC9628178.1 endonuclease/exonuclease/phosphatase family protein [Blastopirellula sediminis]
MTISRRQFCAALAAAGISATALSAAEEKREALRVIAYNVYVCKGWPDDRPLAKTASKSGQMTRRTAMELALYEPDVINFSESPSEEMAKEIAGYLGMNHVRFPSGGNWPGTLLSRYEIVDAVNCPLGYPRPKELFTRHWGKGTIKLPSGDLIVHSAHLMPGPDPAVRLKEVKAMLTSMKEDLDAGRSMLLIGDLNHGPDCEEYKMWIDAGWVDTFAKVGEGDGLTIKADTPQYRIDFVMATGPIAKTITESRPLFEGAFRVNTADSNSFALSDHLPQLATFGEMK